MNNPLGLAPAAEISITHLSRVAGISSRTLRHYDQIGLFRPHRVASNGYRFYTQNQLIQLQRILLLKDMGLGLENIAEIIDKQRDEREALIAHIEQLQAQRQTLDRQIATLEHTISALETGQNMTPETSFDGFNEQYKDEVIQRWGSKAYSSSDHWWRSKDANEQADFMAQVQELNDAWIAAGASQITAGSEAAQLLAARHVQWLGGVPGTPLESKDSMQRASYIESLAEMYVTDERFAKNYGGYAELVRDALKIYVKNISRI